MTRVEKIQKHFPEQVDAFITNNEKTCFYVTEFMFSDGMVFVTRDDATAYTDFRYVESAETEVVGCKVSVGNRFDEIRKTIKDKDIRTIGYEDDLLVCQDLEMLKKEFPTCEFYPMGKIVRDLAEFKDEKEMELVRHAQQITDDAFTAMLGIIKPDMTEIEVAAEIEYQMKKRGASSTSFETIAVSGKNSSRPHGVPRPVKLEKGFLTMDFGCIYKGYCSDMTRTVVIGKADEDMKHLYNTVRTAQHMAEEAVKEGMVASDVDKIARDYIDERGYKGAFGHGLGHGVGIYIHEEPRLSPVGKKILRQGHIFTIEPGIYLKGKYGVRIEDMVQMTKDGPVVITKSPRDIFEF